MKSYFVAISLLIAPCLGVAESTFDADPPRLWRLSTVEAEGKAHQEVAEKRANRYFRYEYNLGSSSIVVRTIEIETNSVDPVDGWVGRFRTSGKAYIVYFDTAGRSAGRTTREFEVLTERKGTDRIEVIGLTVK